MKVVSLSLDAVQNFRNFIWNYYHTSGRQFAWRNVDNPYYILVSEIMLQQTQTYRVEPKFDLFVETFPDFATLAQAELREVLSVWQGLGYNRRGMALHECAKKVVHEFDGKLPGDPETLVTFPGIGKATAASICAFAFNKSTIFIETNIRAVFIHSFFPERDDVHDKEIVPLIEQTLDHENPREWYYALMDYGVSLKKRFKNPSRKSRHHTKQSRFEGSDRQIRGKVLKLLIENAFVAKNEIAMLLGGDGSRVEKILDGLIAEGMIKNRNDILSI